jgi:hypothetical protein
VIASTSEHSRSDNQPILKFQASSLLEIGHQDSYAQKSGFYHPQERFRLRRQNNHQQL